jgi:agmatine/peptidylarginine deiminase
VHVLTPALWNPHLDVYAINEESMLDWEGNLKSKKDREYKIVLDDIPEDDVEMVSLVVSSAESAQIDAAMVDENVNPLWQFIP